MQVRQAMSRNVHTAVPNETIQEAARDMIESDIGFLPVEEDDRMVGMITDRDIAVRAVAEGLGPDTPVRDVMTRDVKYCFEDDEIEDVCRNMADIQVRRLPVVDRDKRLVGVISLCDLASNGNARIAGEALQGISQPGGSHTQRA
jgi:CBS domain-containing protein